MVPIGLVDYGSGNYESVRNALTRIGYEPLSVRTAQDLNTCERLVLPGVGSFAGCLGRLKAVGLIEPIIEVVNSGRPILGICVGLQVLGQASEEFGFRLGIGLIDGHVRRIDTRGSELALPHIGWNSCEIIRSGVLTDGLPPSPEFYFVHSYHLVSADPSDVVGTCEYGETVTAIVERDHIMGVQFHPEKSQQAGLRLLRSFAEFSC